MPAATSKKRTARKKPKPEAALPAAQDWRSTDAQEILRRQLRDREEDRAGYETLQRLAAAGLIQFSSESVRELYPEPQPDVRAPPGLAPEAVARIKILSGKASHHLRLAGVLQASTFAAEARAALQAAALALAQGLAVAAGAAEPAHPGEAMEDEALSRWEWSGLLVQTLSGPEDVSFAAVQEALRKTRVRLHITAGLPEAGN